MCIAIVCKPGFDVIDFEINLIFLIKPFSYITIKSRQKFKYLENEKNFYGEIKSIFNLFKRLSDAKNCLRPQSAPLLFFLINLENGLKKHLRKVAEKNMDLSNQLFFFKIFTRCDYVIPSQVQKSAIYVWCREASYYIPKT